MEKIKAVNKEELVEKGQEIYNKLKDKLLSQYKGKFITIEVDSGDYFIADGLGESIEKAKKKYPNKVFFSARIGYKAAFKFH